MSSFDSRLSSGLKCRRGLVGQFMSLRARVGRLLLMLMLARIDGKSPVEYIVERKKRSCGTS
jgi:hypothetical protein